ncbi:hypothetical protein ACFZC7_28595 [Streptomyces massasporeus]|uniref:hypothetical protein n=1 Tax=Streptomyces massasporeus TaxID=67324 RepID=UPI0036E2B5AC
MAKHEDRPYDELPELGHKTLDVTSRLLAAARRTGVVRPGDPVRLARVAFHTGHGPAVLTVGGLLDDSALAEAADLALNVLLTVLRPGARRPRGPGSPVRAAGRA